MFDRLWHWHQLLNIFTVVLWQWKLTIYLTLFELVEKNQWKLIILKENKKKNEIYLTKPKKILNFLQKSSGN